MIVVTGGAGFIGSNLVAALEERGHTDLAVCDRLGSSEKWRNLGKRELAALIAPEELLSFLENHRGDIEAIFHLGAITSTTETDADLFARENITLSLDLWHWCAGNRTRLIYASSAATYGDGTHGFDDDGRSEALAQLRPLNAYGWSKHVVDRRVVRLAAGGGPTPPQWSGLKFFNVYGPNEYHKGNMASVISRLYPQVLSGEPARLFTSHNPDYPHGGQLRDFVWVGDCVAIMLWLLEMPTVSGLFNVGTGAARTWLDLAHAVFAAAEREPRIEFVAMPEALRDKYQYFTEARTDRLRAAGYHAPFTSLEDGVLTYCRDFLGASDPYR